MKKFVFNFRWFLIGLLIIYVLVGCKQANKIHDQKIIAVSILPQKYFVEKIAGEKYKVIVMIPPGASHENYDPTPEQIISLANAVVYFRNGFLDFENHWVEKFLDSYPNLKFIDLSEHLSLVKNSEDHHHGGIDPHTWMSPSNVKNMAGKIYETLVEMDIKNEKFYSGNYRNFLTELDSLQTEISDHFKNIKTNSFIIYHPALTYYAMDFGLKQYALEMDGKNPSAFHIRALIDIAKKKKIKAILVQKQYDQSKAEIIARETQGSIIEIDPLSEDWSNEILNVSLKLSEAFNNLQE